MLIRSTLAAFALFFALTPSSFARTEINVDGEKAINILEEIQNAGVQARAGRDSGLFEVSNVYCAEGGGIVFLPMHCSLVDALTGKELQIPNGRRLFDALLDAGAKSSAVHRGELHQTTLQASKVGCERGAMTPAACTIEL
jgi:hypothetical protein